MPTLNFAILGLLARGPLTGYEIATRMRRPIGYYWSALHSQIYPALSDLVARGMATYETLEGPGPRDKKRYSVTDSGITSLRQWLLQPPAPQPARSEEILKTYSMWLVDPQSALESHSAQRAVHGERLTEYIAIEHRMHSRWGSALEDVGSPGFSDYATLQRGISFERHCIAWFDWMIQCLQAAADTRVDR